MLPRNGSIERVGSRARSCARRLIDAVPMRIPLRNVFAPISASRGSSRSRYAPTTRPSVSLDVMSLAECTATSMRLSSSASSSSLTKTPRAPISPNGRVRSRSPAVVIGTSAISMPSRRSLSAPRSACVRASLLPREPTRISTAPGALCPRLTTSSSASNTHECCRRLQGKRATDRVRRLQRSSSRPKRWRTASA